MFNVAHERSRSKWDVRPYSHIESVGYTATGSSDYGYSAMLDNHRHFKPGIQRPCEKYSLRWEGESSLTLPADGSDGVTWAKISGSPFSTFVGASLRALDSLTSLPSEGLLSSFGEQTYVRFLTQVEQDLLIGATLVEMREVAQLIPQLQRSLSKTIAGGYLTYSFGWKPTAGDVSSMFALMSSLQASIKRLKDLNNKVTRLTASQRLEHAVLPALPPWTYLADGTWQKLRVRLVSASDRVFASANLHAQLRGLDSIDGMIRAFLTKAGLSNPIETLFELASNSFLLDWFVKVSGLLDRFRVDFLQPYKGKWELHREVLSYKASWRFEVQYWWKRNGNWIHRGYVNVERFVRLPFLPIPILFTVDMNLSPGQLLLSGALLRTKVL